MKGYNRIISRKKIQNNHGLSRIKIMKLYKLTKTKISLELLIKDFLLIHLMILIMHITFKKDLNKENFLKMMINWKLLNSFKILKYIVNLISQLILNLKSFKIKYQHLSLIYKNNKRNIILLSNIWKKKRDMSSWWKTWVREIKILKMIMRMKTMMKLNFKISKKFHRT